MTAQATDTLLCRRTLLARGGTLMVTFALTSRLVRAETARPADKAVAADQVAGFIAIDTTGKVTIYSGKVELGHWRCSRRSPRSPPKSYACHSIA